ncbi:MAG: hypothetical protein ACI35W_05475 [Anaeroplasmataceae bacterium]
MDDEVIFVEGIPLTLKQLNYYVKEKRIIIVSSKKLNKEINKYKDRIEALEKENLLLRTFNML